MKRILLFSAWAVLAIATTSCASVKKDCQGKRHYRQANGIYL